jgi:hypothetical protein
MENKLYKMHGTYIALYFPAHRVITIPVTHSSIQTYLNEGLHIMTENLQDGFLKIIDYTFLMYF